MGSLVSLRKKLTKASIFILVLCAVCLILNSTAQGETCYDEVDPCNGDPPCPQRTYYPCPSGINYQNTLNDFEDFLNGLLDQTMTGQAAGGNEPTSTSPLLTNPEVYRLYKAFLNSGEDSEEIMRKIQEKLKGATDATIMQIVKQLSGLLGAT